MATQSEDGEEGNEPSSGGDSVEELLRSTDKGTEAVVEQLRESGTRRHVSGSSVDDVLAEIATPQDEASERDGFALSGEPTRHISTAGIDEVFEQLEAEAGPPADEGDERTTLDPAGGEGDRSDPRVRRSPTRLVDEGGEKPTFDDVESDAEDAFGSLAGGGPTRTVSDRSVDEILELVDEPDDGDDEPDDEDDEPHGDAAALRPADPEAAMADLVSEGAAALPDAAEVPEADASDETAAEPAAGEWASTADPDAETDETAAEPAEADASDRDRAGEEAEPPGPGRRAPSADADATDVDPSPETEPDAGNGPDPVRPGENDPLEAATKARENVEAILSDDRHVGPEGEDTPTPTADAGAVDPDADAIEDAGDPSSGDSPSSPPADAAVPSGETGTEEQVDETEMDGEGETIEWGTPEDDAEAPIEDAEPSVDDVESSVEPAEEPSDEPAGDGAARPSVEAASDALGELAAARDLVEDAPWEAEGEGAGPTTEASGPDASTDDEPDSGGDPGPARSDAVATGERRDASRSRPLVTRAELEEIASQASDRDRSGSGLDAGSVPPLSATDSAARVVGSAADESAVSAAGRERRSRPRSGRVGNPIARIDVATGGPDALDRGAPGAERPGIPRGGERGRDGAVVPGVGGDRSRRAKSDEESGASGDGTESGDVGTDDAARADADDSSADDADDTSADEGNDGSATPGPCRRLLDRLLALFAR